MRTANESGEEILTGRSSLRARRLERVERAATTERPHRDDELAALLVQSANVTVPGLLPAVQSPAHAQRSPAGVAAGHFQHKYSPLGGDYRRSDSETDDEWGEETGSDGSMAGDGGQDEADDVAIARLLAAKPMPIKRLLAAVESRAFAGSKKHKKNDQGPLLAIKLEQSHSRHPKQLSKIVRPWCALVWLATVLTFAASQMDALATKPVGVKTFVADGASVPRQRKLCGEGGKSLAVGLAAQSGTLTSLQYVGGMIGSWLHGILTLRRCIQH